MGLTLVTISTSISASKVIANGGADTLIITGRALNTTAYGGDGNDSLSINSSISAGVLSATQEMIYLR